MKGTRVRRPIEHGWASVQLIQASEGEVATRSPAGRRCRGAGPTGRRSIAEIARGPARVSGRDARRDRGRGPPARGGRGVLPGGVRARARRHRAHRARRPVAASQRAAVPPPRVLARRAARALVPGPHARRGPRGERDRPEDQQRIFGRFERASSERDYGGLGLGLFIARQLAEAMGGMITLESELGAGTTFRVEVPR